MATVIYKPQSQAGLTGAANALGQGMSQGLIKEFDRQEKQERIKQVQSAFEGIRKAAEQGGRKAALEAANIAMGLAEDPADVRTIQGYVDQVAPPDEFQQVPIVDSENRPSVAFLPKRELGSLHTPQGQALLPPGTRVGTPEETFEYITPPTQEGATPGYTKAPKGKAPEGAVPLPAFQVGQQLAREKRAERREDRAEGREDRMEQESNRRWTLQQQSAARQEATSARAAAAAERAARNTQADNFRADASRGNASLRALSSRQMEDGSWQFIGENEKKLYAQRVPFFESRLEQEYARSRGGVVNVGKILEETIAKYPGPESRAEEPATPPPSKPAASEGKPNFLSRAGEAIKGAKDALMGRGEAPQLKGTVQEQQAQYDKLEPGQEFIGPDGKRYKKPGKK